MTAQASVSPRVKQEASKRGTARRHLHSKNHRGPRPPQVNFPAAPRGWVSRPRVRPPPPAAAGPVRAAHSPHRAVQHGPGAGRGPRHLPCTSQRPRRLRLPAGRQGGAARGGAPVVTQGAGPLVMTPRPCGLQFHHAPYRGPRAEDSSLAGKPWGAGTWVGPAHMASATPLPRSFPLPPRSGRAARRKRSGIESARPSLRSPAFASSLGAGLPPPRASSSSSCHPAGGPHTHSLRQGVATQACVPTPGGLAALRARPLPQQAASPRCERGGLPLTASSLSSVYTVYTVCVNCLKYISGTGETSHLVKTLAIPEAHGEDRLHRVVPDLHTCAMAHTVIKINKYLK